jgi:hypothetical protein
MVMLIREARVSPEWEFSGRVETTPEFAKAMQHALGEKPSAPQPEAAKPAKKKGGFWASLRRAFVGGAED